MHGWTELAACRGLGELFFSTDRKDERAAVRICRTCPVRRECEADALTFEWAVEHWGVRAGRTARQRDALRLGVRRPGGGRPRKLAG